MKPLIALALTLTTTMAFGQQDDKSASPAAIPAGGQIKGDGVDGPPGFGFDPAPPVDPNDPYRGMKPVKRDAAALEKVLANTQTLTLVVDDMTWFHHRLPTSFDETAIQLLAGAILESIEGDDKAETLLRNAHAAELHIAYTSKMYEQSGKYIPNVLETLKRAADERQVVRTQERTRQLLAGTRESANSDASRSRDLSVSELITKKIVPGNDQKTVSQLREEYMRAEQRSLALAQQIGTGALLSVQNRTDIYKAGIKAIDPALEELPKAVREAFELRIKLQTAELDQAEARIKAARERLTRRQQSAEKLIQERIRELSVKSIDATDADLEGKSE